MKEKVYEPMQGFFSFIHKKISYTNKDCHNAMQILDVIVKGPTYTT